MGSNPTGGIFFIYFVREDNLFTIKVITKVCKRAAIRTLKQ